jgi:hypothetical protein
MADIELTAKFQTDIDVSLSAGGDGHISVSFWESDVTHRVSLADLAIYLISDADVAAHGDDEFRAAEVGRARLVAALEALIDRVKAETV